MMRRLVIQEIIKMCAKSIALTTIIGIIIGVTGYINQWDSTITYSNAFFLAGSLVIIAGTSSRLGAGQEVNTFRSISAESLRGMSSSEQADFIINASSSAGTLILGLLTGILLMLISAIAGYLL